MTTIGLSMIVKDGEATIRACLESVRGIVDQIVIADTGSTDKSREIAQGMGATVISVPWENHFAKARNAGRSRTHRHRLGSGAGRRRRIGPPAGKRISA